MDRFIAAPAPAITLCNYNLKSNMDRFIVNTPVPTENICSI